MAIKRSLIDGSHEGVDDWRSDLKLTYKASIESFLRPVKTALRIIIQGSDDEDDTVYASIHHFNNHGFAIETTTEYIMEVMEDATSRA